MDNYTEKLELPEGQWAVLLTRLPADRTLIVRSAAARMVDEPAFVNEVCRAMLWEASLKDCLTGETVDVDEYGKADPVVVDMIQAKAFALYVEWAAQTFPKVKAATGRASNGKHLPSASPRSARSRQPTPT